MEGWDIDLGKPGQWTLATVPTASNDVLINALPMSSNTYSITVDQGSAVAHSIIESQPNAKLEILNGGTLTLGDNLSIVGGTFQINSDTTLKRTAAAYSNGIVTVREASPSSPRITRTV
jgi:hypothetical protein